MLQGARCVLRPYTRNDAAVLQAIANDRDVSRWMTAGFPSPYTRTDAVRWLSSVVNDPEPNNFGVEADGELAGGIGMMPQAGEHAGVATFGYWLGRRFWGRGLATDAARTLARHALRVRGLRRLEANVFAPNVASARVLEKAGFRCEGRFREAYVQRDGSVCDGLLYARLESDPEPTG